MTGGGAILLAANAVEAVAAGAVAAEGTGGADVAQLFARAVSGDITQRSVRTATVRTAAVQCRRVIDRGIAAGRAPTTVWMHDRARRSARLHAHRRQHHGHRAADGAKRGEAKGRSWWKWCKKIRHGWLGQTWVSERARGF